MLTERMRRGPSAKPRLLWQPAGGAAVAPGEGECGRATPGSPPDARVPDCRAAVRGCTVARRCRQRAFFASVPNQQLDSTQTTQRRTRYGWVT